MAFDASGITWTDRTITWSIATTNYGGQPGGAFGSFITSQAVINQIATAASWWDGASGLTFQFVADSANVDIRFGYGVVDGSATGRASYSYDQQNHFLPGTTVRLEYSDSNPPPTSLIAHEIGHVLGLDHFEAEQAIMNSTVNNAWNGLFASDIEGIRSLYGAQEAANTPPVATINDHSLGTNVWSRVASWISYSDAQGNPATQYQFWDGGTGANSGYFWTPSNAHHPAGTAITVAAADLSNVWIRGGAAGGTESMYVRAFDGSAWSDWDLFNFTTIANTPPVAINNHSLQENQWSQVASWISYSDANGNPATQYQFWDGQGAADSGYFWTPGNAHHPAGQAITVAAADLSSVWIRGGQAGGSETMYVRAFDGTDWSAWDAFTLTTIANTPPVATINDHSLNANQWSQVASWISYSDANGNPATQYQFWDGGAAANSGYFWTPANAHHPAGTAITVAAADLGNVWVRGGQSGGSETMYVRAFDGSDWSAWDAFNLNTLLIG